MEVNIFSIAFVCVVGGAGLIAIVIGLQAVGYGAVLIWNRLPPVLRRALFKTYLLLAIAFVAVAVVYNLVVFISDPGSYLGWLIKNVSWTVESDFCQKSKGLCF